MENNITYLPLLFNWFSRLISNQHKVLILTFCKTATAEDFRLFWPSNLFPTPESVLPRENPAVERLTRRMCIVTALIVAGLEVLSCEARGEC